MLRGLQLQLLACKNAGCMDCSCLQCSLQLLPIRPFADCGCPGEERELCAARLQSSAGAACLINVVDGIPGIPKIHSACKHIRALPCGKSERNWKAAGHSRAQPGYETTLGLQYVGSAGPSHIQAACGCSLTWVS